MNKTELAMAIASNVISYYVGSDIEKMYNTIVDDLLHWAEYSLVDMWLLGVDRDFAEWVIREVNRHGFLPYECTEAHFNGNDFCFI